MKELCLFIVIFAGCNFLYHIIIRFFYPQNFRLAFRIPTYRDFNIIAGSIFFIIAAVLLFPNLYRIGIFLALCLILYGLFLYTYKTYLCGGFCPCPDLCCKYAEHSILLLQKLNNINQHSITPTEALRMVGLPTFKEPSDFINQKNHILETVSKRGKIPHNLKQILEQAEQAFSPKTKIN